MLYLQRQRMICHHPQDFYHPLLLFCVPNRYPKIVVFDSPESSERTLKATLYTEKNLTSFSHFESCSLPGLHFCDPGIEPIFCPFIGTHQDKSTSFKVISPELWERSTLTTHQGGNVLQDLPG